MRILFNNLVVFKEYFESIKSNIQWQDWVWQVIEDTFYSHGTLAKVGRKYSSKVYKNIKNKVISICKKLIGRIDDMKVIYYFLARVIISLEFQSILLNL